MSNVEYLKTAKPSKLRRELMALQTALEEAQQSISEASRAQIEQMEQQRVRNEVVLSALESGDVEAMEAVKAELYPRSGGARRSA